MIEILNPKSMSFSKRFERW